MENVLSAFGFIFSEYKKVLLRSFECSDFINKLVKKCLVV